MTKNRKTIKCKSCAKTMATISDTGLVPDPSASETEGCDTCHKFLSLHNAMKVADADYALFKDRRDNYMPKQEALATLRKSHIEFDNWLMHVEEVYGDVQHALPNAYLESNNDLTGVDEQHRGMKRSRSLSQSPTQTARSPSSSSKGYYSNDSLPEYKRLKFSNSVEYREDYRPSQFYSRNDAAYVRGRYAPPEGSTYLDTSGSDKTFLKFTGMKKVGKAWVDVWKEDTDDDTKVIKAEVARANTVSVPEIENEHALSYSGEHVTEPEAASTEAQRQGLARRRSISTDTAFSRRSIHAKTQSGQTKSSHLFKSSAIPHMISNEKVIRKQGVERMETSVAAANQKVASHEYPTKQHCRAKSQKKSTEGTQQEVEEGENYQGDQLDSGEGTFATTCDGRRKTTEESREKQDLADCIFSTPTTTKKQEPSMNRGSQQNPPVKHEQERVDEPPRKKAEATAGGASLSHQTLDPTLKSTSSQANVKESSIDLYEPRDSYRSVMPSRKRSDPLEDQLSRSLFVASSTGQTLGSSPCETSAAASMPLLPTVAAAKMPERGDDASGDILVMASHNGKDKPGREFGQAW